MNDQKVEAGAVSLYGSTCVTSAHAPFTDDQSALNLSL